MTNLLIGAGNMGLEYAKVIKNLGYDFEVIGRKSIKSSNFNMMFPDIKFHYDLESIDMKQITNAIVAVNIENLFDVTQKLINKGIPNILIEKPGVLYPEQIKILSEMCSKNDSKVLVAYNRRFYKSIQKAMEIILQDGGAIYTHFEFSENSEIMLNIDLPQEVKQKWLISNSSHIFDVVIFLCGELLNLKQISAGGIRDHKSGSIFTGIGNFPNGGVFSYGSIWGNSGRWSIEIVTNNHRIRLRPIEEIQIFDNKINDFIGLMEIEEYKIDKIYKPGLYNQTMAFLKGEHSSFCTLDNQFYLLKLLGKIGKYY